ncbi:MAG TPA: isoprenylcysteine carboxylmethyltransferase family protein [Casimicrobiaceae bacterium]|nr:isoprenylcysteine carboxylmethyltransferase family protein [Casimicrobiaceae bacterium]
MHDFPLLLLALTVSAYWIGVGVMVVRVRRHLRRDAGLVPEQPRERAMWVVWVPLVAAWVALPWLAQGHADGWLGLPSYARAPAFVVVRSIAAFVGLCCWLATLRCYGRMGDDWRMDVSSRATALITDGPFSRIRHPIYAFSILLMLASAVVLPTVPMLVVALVHIALMNLKARNEEAHLASMHGADYARYVARTGRFVPRFTTREP